MPDEAWLRRMSGAEDGAADPRVGRPAGWRWWRRRRRPRPAYLAFAEELGAGFQIVDDVLDATGTDEQLGKPAGSDVAHDKRTFVTVLGIERARELADDSERAALALLDALPGRTDSLAGLAERVYARDR